MPIASAVFSVLESIAWVAIPLFAAGVLAALISRRVHTVGRIVLCTIGPVLLYIPGVPAAVWVWDQGGEGNLIFLVAWFAASVGLVIGTLAGWGDQRRHRKWKRSSHAGSA
jgi:hypothetical protein